jgi:Fic family protein
MEPLLPEGHKSNLADLTTRITFEAGRLSGSRIPQKTREGVEKVVRQMNSYYSNLIEGHKTNPLEVEKALKKNFDEDPKKKALQQLGVAHIETEELVRKSLQDNPKTNIWSPEFLKMIHQEFYSRLPPELRIAKDTKDREYTLVPGEFRNYNVNVARHIPPDHPCIAAFMERFESFYGSSQIVSTRRLTSIAASHHRLLWIHPFGDGNGRVARLFSHAALIQSGLDGYGLWTLARGLARRREDYYKHLAMADQTRFNDYDGRGNLSAECLANFCEFFLDTILDQIKFMSSVLEYDGLKHRIENYVFRNNIFGKHNEQGKHLLLEALHEGEYQRGEAMRLTGFAETVARELLQIALNRELLASDGPRSPVRLGFPNEVLEDYFPKLFMPSV